MFFHMLWEVASYDRRFRSIKEGKFYNEGSRSGAVLGKGKRSDYRGPRGSFLVGHLAPPLLGVYVGMGGGPPEGYLGGTGRWLDGDESYIPGSGRCGPGPRCGSAGESPVVRGRSGVCWSNIAATSANEWSLSPVVCIFRVKMIIPKFVAESPYGLIG